MADPCFEGLLRDVVSIRRPEVALSPGGSPRTPVYGFLTGDVPCSLQPVSSTFRDTLIGALERITHVAYLQPTDLRPGDLLVEHLMADALSEAASEGDQTVKVVGGTEFSVGDGLEVGGGEGSELSLSTWISNGTIGLSTPLEFSHEAGSPVSSIVGYEVLGVWDEAGYGHHLRATLRMLTA